MNNLITIQEVAETMKVSQATILRWVKAKKIEGFFRVGRKWLIRENDLEKYISNKIGEEKV